jgi:hypothetical protein
MATDPFNRANQTRNIWNKFWESLRTRATLFVALISIVGTFINYYTVNVPQVYWLLGGILLTCIGFLGFYFFNEWLAIKVHVLALAETERKLEVEELKKRVSNELVNSVYSIVYGLSYENLLVHGELDDKGAMVVTRQSKIVAHSAGVKTLDQYLTSEAPEGKIELVDFKCLTPFREVIPQLQQTSASKFSLALTINPALIAGENLEFVLIEKTPPGAATLNHQSMEERGKPFPYECFFWDITRPTYSLQLVVRMPLAFEPDSSEPDVWYGELRVRHDKEYLRIKGNYSAGRAGTFYELRLNVKHPLPGLRACFESYVMLYLYKQTAGSRARRWSIIRTIAA